MMEDGSIYKTGSEDHFDNTQLHAIWSTTDLRLRKSEILSIEMVIADLGLYGLSSVNAQTVLND